MTVPLRRAPSSPTPGSFRELLPLAAPLILSTASHALMQFADRMMLSRHDLVEIQAALPAGLLAFTLTSFFFATTGFVNTFVAQYHGANDLRSAARITTQGIILALSVWPLIMGLILPGRLILEWSGHPPNVLAAEKTYFEPLMLGSLAIPLGAAISGYYTGRGWTGLNMAAMIAGNVVNIVLDYAWIFGRWGFPEWGIRGAAWATVIAGFIPPLFLLAHYFSPSMRRAAWTLAELRWDGALLRRLLRFGMPAGFHYLLDTAGFTLFVLILGRMGEAPLAASNIAFSINHLSFMPVVGLGIAASILVGHYQGRGDSVTAEKAAWTTMKAGWIYMGAMAILFLAIPGPLFRLFIAGHNPESMENILRYARPMMAMCAIWGFLDAVNIIFAGALKGAGDTAFVMLWSVVMCWGVWLVGEWVLIVHLGAGVVAAWIWLTVYIIVLGLGFMVRVRSGRWKTIQVIERPIPVLPLASSSDARLLVE